MEHHQKAKIHQAIALLNDIVGGSTNKSAPGPNLNILPNVDAQLAKASKMASTLEPQIQQLNSAFIQSFEFMKKVIAYSAVCKKFNSDTEQKLKDKFMSFSKLTEAVEKNQNFIPHAKAIRQLISATFWVFTAPEMVFKGNIQSADFYALKFKTKKVMPHNEWYNTLMEGVKMTESFAKENYAMGISFNSNGSSNWDELFSGSKQVEVPQAQIQQPKPSQQQPKQEVKKGPKKQLVGLNWNISNFEGEQIVINENQISMKNGIFVQNCKNCVIKVLGKFKSILVNKCESVAVIVINCISGVEIMNCVSITVQIKEQAPSISVDKSTKTRILLTEKNMNCDIVTSKISELNLSYLKEDGNEAKDYMIPQQLMTRWNPISKKFETKVYDQFM